LIDIHVPVKNTDNLDLVFGKEVVKDHVTLERVLAQARFNVIAGVSKFWRIRQQ
jgi:hypothetical protein